MIGTKELQAAFGAIGAAVRLTPTGLDFRVVPGRSGIEVGVIETPDGPSFELRVNFTRVVDLRVVEVDSVERYLVLSADDWGDTLDAPPRVFRCGVSDDELYADAVTEFSADE